MGKTFPSGELASNFSDLEDLNLTPSTITGVSQMDHRQG